MPAKKPKYQTIVESMRREIVDLEAGTSYLTDAEAIERYGVSRITVRRAFAELEREGYITRARGRGTTVCDRSRREVRSVAFMGSCIVKNGTEPLMLRGIEDFLREEQTNVVLCNTENNVERAFDYATRLVSSGVDGVILLPLLKAEETNAELAETILGEGIPLVLLNRTIPSIENRVSSIVPDDRSGFRKLTENLLSLGHRRIAFLSSVRAEFSSSLRERRAGYREALVEQGVEPDPALDQHSVTSEIPLAVSRWISMEDPPTAIMADNDLPMLAVMKTVLEQGLRIPEDISVTGCDDLPNLPCPVPHTTLSVPYYEMGRMAASESIGAEHDPSPAPHKTKVPVEMRIRESTAVCSGAISGSSR